MMDTPSGRTSAEDADGDIDASDDKSLFQFMLSVNTIGFFSFTACLINLLIASALKGDTVPSILHSAEQFKPRDIDIARFQVKVVDTRNQAIKCSQRIVNGNGNFPADRSAAAARPLKIKERFLMQI